jgi:hypothetical protein
MSDILNRFDLNKFIYSISLSAEHCLSYLGKASVMDRSLITGEGRGGEAGGKGYFCA